MIYDVITPVKEDGDFSDYNRMGRESAASAKGNPEQLKSSLHIIYNENLKKATLDEKSKKDRIVSNNSAKNRLQQKLVEANTTRKTKQLEVDSKNNDIKAIKENRGHDEIIPFVISTIITILLTFFLWIFYSGSSYGALNGDIVKENEIASGLDVIFVALVNLKTLGDNLTKTFYMLFPVIFIALGFQIHDSLVKRTYYWIFLLLLFTFSVDCLIGYKISENLYNGTEPWKPIMVLSNPDFYLILTCGFVSYIIWGFMLNSTLQKYNEMQPSVREKNLLEEIGLLEIAIAKIQGEIAGLEAEISEIEKSNEAIERGVVFINVSELRSFIGAFMKGWGAWLHLMRPAEASRLIEVCNGIEQEWFEELRKSDNNKVVFKA